MKIVVFLLYMLEQLCCKRVVCLLLAGVTVNVLHPGSVQTNLYSHMPEPLRFIFLNIVSPLLFRVRWSAFFVLAYRLLCQTQL